MVMYMSRRRLDQYGCTKLLFTHVTQDLSKALFGALRVDIIITLHVQIPIKIIFTVFKITSIYSISHKKVKVPYALVRLRYLRGTLEVRLRYA